ncbi:MAG: NAD(P)-dependent oxidoreductase [Chloroflexi bacterium]|nr:NAD(P)-dependent oxidoreductase [Chloroflexota bacterium]MBV9892980.1 NAD(P)-dependent oxidoreductase [Chloroflexota bacterium]
MKFLVFGGTGFIGNRVLRKLLDKGHEVAAFDINPNLPAYDADLVGKVQVLRGDITLMDDVVEAMLAVKPDHVLNLAYLMGGGDPHTGVRLNVLGMDNCFEAARLCGIKRVVYASSLTVYGEQRNFGERPVVETDFRHGSGLYAASKIYNEHQAEWYSTAYGMQITGLRPAHVTGWDKVRGSTDHVKCITEPARGLPVEFAFRDAMRLPVHVADVAEMFTRLVEDKSSKHAVYNTGGYGQSLGDLAQLVKQFLPDAQITFKEEVGGRDSSPIYYMDNTRWVDEYDYPLPLFEERVLEMINEVRQDAGLPLVQVDRHVSSRM